MVNISKDFASYFITDEEKISSVTDSEVCCLLLYFQIYFIFVDDKYLIYQKMALKTHYINKANQCLFLHFSPQELEICKTLILSCKKVSYGPGQCGLVGALSHNQKIVSSITSLGTYRRQPLTFLSHMDVFLSPPSLKKTPNIMLIWVIMGNWVH